MDEQVLALSHPVEVFSWLWPFSSDLCLKDFETWLASGQDIKTIGQFHIGILSSEDINALIFDLISFGLTASGRLFLIQLVLFSRQKDRHHLVLGKPLLQFLSNSGDGQLEPKLFSDVVSRKFVEQLVFTVDSSLNIFRVTDTSKYSPYLHCAWKQREGTLA